MTDAVGVTRAFLFDFETTRLTASIFHILSVLIIVSVCVLSFASDFSDLLDKAKDLYAKGNLNEAINLIDSARKILDKESLSKSAEEYIEVTNWDVVKLKKKDYMWKKVKIKAEFGGVNSSGKSIHLYKVKRL